jgi:hypothetical protein
MNSIPRIPAMRRQEERAVDLAHQGGKLMLFNLFLY